MKMRRLELAILAITLAFAVFMGGYFTGRSQKSLNVTTVSTQLTPQPALQQTQENRTNTNPENPTANTENPGNTENPATQEVQVQTGNGKININTASRTELTDLPGIGNTLAQRIIDYRQRNGNFSKIEDIRNVSGIGERRFEAIEDLITVGN